MAREVRDADVIEKTGIYYEEVCAKLKNAKTSFLAHVRDFQTNYVGVDANAISNILINAINRIEELIAVLTYYSEYMLAISKHDNENFDNIIKKIRSKNVLQPLSSIEETLLSNNMEGEITNNE